MANTTHLPFICGDADCDERSNTADRRCPWCWGGYPVDFVGDPYNLRASETDPFVGLS